MDQCLLHEELYRGLAPVHAIGGTHTVAGILKHYGSEQQKKEILSAIAGGAPMSISISEPRRDRTQRTSPGKRSCGTADM